MRYPLNVRERIGLAVVAAIVAADLCWVMCTRRGEQAPASSPQSVPTAVHVVSEPQDTTPPRTRKDRRADHRRKAPESRKGRKKKTDVPAKKRSAGKEIPTPQPSRDWTGEQIPSSR